MDYHEAHTAILGILKTVTDRKPPYSLSSRRIAYHVGNIRIELYRDMNTIIMNTVALRTAADLNLLESALNAAIVKNILGA